MAILYFPIFSFPSPRKQEGRRAALHLAALRILARHRLAVLLRHLDDDALDFGVGLQAVLAQFAAQTRLFEAAERRLGLQNVVTVDPDGNRNCKEKTVTTPPEPTASGSSAATALTRPCRP